MTRLGDAGGGEGQGREHSRMTPNFLGKELGGVIPRHLKHMRQCWFGRKMTDSLLNLLSLKWLQAVPGRVMQWAVEYTCLKLWRELWAGDGLV